MVRQFVVLLVAQGPGSPASSGHASVTALNHFSLLIGYRSF